MELIDNTAWAWSVHNAVPEPPFVTAAPEANIDGDLFWIWFSGGAIHMSFEEVTGQASAAVRWLIETHPELADMPFHEDSPCGDWNTLQEAAEAPLPDRRVADVRTWFHGTSSAKLGRIAEEGLHAALDHGDRAWRNVIDPDVGTVYLAERVETAAQYADKAAAIFGGEPVILEILAAEVELQSLCEDRDFRHTHEWVEHSGQPVSTRSAADASLTYDGKVGYLGRISADAITAVHRRIGCQLIRDDSHGSVGRRP